MDHPLIPPITSVTKGISESAWLQTVIDTLPAANPVTLHPGITLKDVPQHLCVLVARGKVCPHRDPSPRGGCPSITYSTCTYKSEFLLAWFRHLMFTFSCSSAIFCFIKAEILINHTVPGVEVLRMQNTTTLILR